MKCESCNRVREVVALTHGGKHICRECADKPAHCPSCYLKCTVYDLANEDGRCTDCQDADEE